MSTSCCFRQRWTRLKLCGAWRHKWVSFLPRMASAEASEVLFVVVSSKGWNHSNNVLRQVCGPPHSQLQFRSAARGGPEPKKCFWLNGQSREPLGANSLSKTRVRARVDCESVQKTPKLPNTRKNIMERCFPASTAERRKPLTTDSQSTGDDFLKFRRCSGPLASQPLCVAQCQNILPI